MKHSFFYLPSLILCAGLLVQCAERSEGTKEEQIRIDTLSYGDTDTSGVNSIKGNLSLQQLATYPQNVVLTGLNEHRLVTIYKTRVVKRSERSEYSSYSYYEDEDSDEGYRHFMPGIDLLQGYNLLNLAHYDMTTEKTNLLFEHPVLVKSLYYPSYIQDSLYKKPINRDYFLVSAYDADTNQDTLINRHDLRRIYRFNAPCTERQLLLPQDYSVIRSQYDPRNDAMFLFAKLDANKNGTIDPKEPLHVFRISLQAPAPAKRVY